MTFKEKHLLPLMMSAVVMTSCGDVKYHFSKDKEKDDTGLLDERPLNDSDKYGTSVVLAQVNIPVYDKKGNRLKDQYVLSRGLQKSSYESVQKFEKMSTKPVYLNGSGYLNYVKADDNNAIYTERGFCGLFIDDNKKAVVVADKNINQFTTDLGLKRLNKPANNEQNRNYIRSSNMKEEDLSQVTDTITPREMKDSVTVDTIGASPDTLVNKSTFDGKQFLDTLQLMRQKEL